MTAIAPQTLILNWLLALPFFAALAVALFPRLKLRPHSPEEARAMVFGPLYVAALVCLMGLGLTLSVLPLATSSRPITADYWWTRDLYHLRLQADALSTPVVLALYALGLLIILHLLGRPPSQHIHHRAALILTALGCGIAAALSADLILLLFSLEAALLALWLLASLDSPRPADLFLANTHTGGLLLLGGILLLWRETGDGSLAALPLLLVSTSPAALRLIGLLILLGLLPRLAAVPGHAWLPRLAHSTSSAALPIAALLPLVAGIALFRLLPGALAIAYLPALGNIGLLIGILTLWSGALKALLARDIRHLAAWLTIAQAGHLLIGISAAALPWAPPQVLQGALLHLLLAPLALLALWCAAGALLDCLGSGSPADLTGLFTKMPLAALALLSGGLSLVGLPPLAGFHAQRLLLSGLATSGASWLVIPVVLADALILAAVLNLFRRLFLGRKSSTPLRWRSPWFSFNLALLILLLLALGLWPASPARWADGVLHTVLAISP